MLIPLLLLAQAQASNGVPADNPALRHPNGRAAPVITAAPVSRPPSVDGRLDDAAWGAANPISGFTQTYPEDGGQASERTEVRVLFTEDALYIGARLFDQDPSAIVGRLGRRDAGTSSDQFQVNIDSYHDHRTTFEFWVNPSGTKGDGISTNDNAFADDSWDPVWEVATSVDDEGWVVEMRIPFSQLRFSAAERPVWGINFQRSIQRRNETVVWSYKPRTEQAWASAFGHLVGLENIPAPRQLEVLPYTVARATFDETADPADPFNDGSTQGATVGLDVNFGLTSNLTLNATVNPDFGQVEADPAVVNLSAFETFFQERRPFFVEGANLFQFGAGSGGFVFGAPQLFYSRRVGRSPSIFAQEPGGGYADNPDASRILGAGKLSGRVGSWSVGLLQAVTERTYATLEAPDGTRSTQQVEPFTSFSVASLRRDFRGGGTGIGVMATNVTRDLNNPAFSFLRSDAQSAGLDFFHRFGNNRYAINGSVSGSRIAGDPVAITAAQRSSARYYQRPDQDYVSVDSAATSLEGWATSMTAGKVSGNWTFGTDFFAYSPGFEVNDAGFQTQTDRIFNGFRLSRRFTRPGAIFQNATLNATFAQNWNFGGTRVGRSLFLGANGTFRNYMYAGVNLSRNFGVLSDKQTRGGPLLAFPSQWNTNVFFGTDGRKPVALDGYSYYARNEYGGYGGGVGGSLRLRPTSAMTVSLSPSYDRSHSIGFYVTSRGDALATATYGRRYVFSTLDQSTVGMTLRADLALSPTLSVQLYAQPFLAAADYSGFKEFAQPETFDFVEYGVDAGSTIDLTNGTYTVDPDGAGPANAFTFGNPDFRFRSLRTNLVVRWEYLPGSTVFFVWNHGRSGASPDPTFRVGPEFRELWRDDQVNTLLVKVNYWISL